MKAWYESKIVWAMAIQSLISTLLLVQEWYSKGDFSIPGCIGLAVGVLVIVLRVWFTEEPVDTPKAQMRQRAQLAAEVERTLAEAYETRLNQHKGS